MTGFVLRNKRPFLAGLFLFISMFCMSKKIEADKFSLRAVFFSFLFGVENTTLVLRDSVRHVFTNSLNIKELIDRLESAEKRVLFYREQSFLYEQIKKENDKLREMIGIKQRFAYPVQYSRVIFRDPTLLSDSLIINKGTQDGIELNMPVVYSSEETKQMVLVGKIIEVAKYSSKVRLATAKNFFIGVRLGSEGYTGVLRGQGSWSESLLVDYIPVESSISVGEPVFSSGESDIYPSDIYIGDVRGVTRNMREEFFKTLFVKPQFNYKTLSEVFVLQYKVNHELSKITGEEYDK